MTARVQRIRLVSYGFPRPSFGTKAGEMVAKQPLVDTTENPDPDDVGPPGFDTRDALAYASEMPAFKPLPPNRRSAAGAGEDEHVESRPRVSTGRCPESLAARLKARRSAAGRSLLLLGAFLAGLVAGGGGATYVARNGGLELVSAWVPRHFAAFLAAGAGNPRRGVLVAGEQAGVGGTALDLARDTGPTERPPVADPNGGNLGERKTRGLIAAIERQLEKGQLERPAGDNALETYERLVANAPEAPGVAQIGTRLSAAFWRSGTAAMKEKRWDDAIRVYDILKRLPPVPRAIIEAQQEELSPGPLSPVAASQGGSRGEIPLAPDPAGAPPAIAAQPDTAPDPKDAGANDMAAIAPPAPAASRAKDAGAGTTERRDETAVLSIARGNEAANRGDFISARRFYELAASRGSAAAATAVGRTYDPLFLKERGVRGALADPEAAKRWYAVAADRGDAEASMRLDRLLAR
jgi:hypothetical protein